MRLIVWNAFRIVAVSIVAFIASAAVAHGRELTFDDRVAAQESIERVYYSHQIGAERSFEEALPRGLLERKVVQYLKQSAALEEFWHTPVTAEMLQRELQRMGLGTRLPDRLRELFAALDDDPFVIQETLARATLVDRLTRNFYAFDPKIHAALRQETDALHQALTDGTLDPWQEHPRRTDAELIRESDDRRSDRDPRITLPAARFDRWRDRLPAAPGEVGPLEEGAEAFHISVLLEEDDTSVRLAVYRVEKTPWIAWWQSVSPELQEAGAVTVALAGSLFSSGIGQADRTWNPDGWDFGEAPATGGAPCADDGTWDNGSLDDAPEPRVEHTAVWTGSHMLVWGGLVDNITETNTGERYDPATDTWTPTSVVDAPSPRLAHTAVWTGGLMLIWGGDSGPPFYNHVDTGGRYDPASDSWTPTSTLDAPVPRGSHAAVWAGNLMLVWGGEDDSVLNSGGRYDPATDSWMPTSIAGAPSPRYQHTAVWSGSRMLIWGGRDLSPSNIFYNTGGRYNPVTDTWTPTSVTVGVPSARRNHTAVWTGTLMLVWGGMTTGNTYIGTGARYDPTTDSWTPISNAYAPSPRNTHTAVWTGSLMMVWGGYLEGTLASSGGRYDPAFDSWTSTSLSGAPSPRARHTAVWTGDLMLIWGGSAGLYVNSGGRYDPATNTWTPTSTGGAPASRDRHTAVWTGSLMLIWGGIGCEFSCTFLDSGARYDPATDTWTPTSNVGTPSPRALHTAVWADGHMLVWGGGFSLDTGGRYDPLSDSWTPTSIVDAPSGRYAQTAVWTGSLMLIWGGIAYDGGYTYFNSGGSYEPTTDSWTPTSTTGAPSPRVDHTAVWTGSFMLVWGGTDGSSVLNTGGRYDPATDSWTPTSTVHPPAPRYRHTAVWTGSHMLVWGGQAASFFNTGGLYDHATDTWLPTLIVDAPSPRYAHSAIWTGSQMVIWGGYGGSYFDTGGRYDPVENTWTAALTIDAPSPRASHTAVWTGSHMLVWGGGNASAPMNTGGRYALGHSLDDDSDGYSECAGDCNDGNASIFPGAPELCDGLDNDCDFTIDEEAGPPEIAGLTFESECTLSWQPLPPGLGAIHHIARGLLEELPVGSGVAEICLASEPGSTTTDPDSPVAGVGYWYLVRGRNDCGTGSYGQQSDTTERMTAVCP